MPCNKSFIDQASSVKMAGYWPRCGYVKQGVLVEEICHVTGDGCWSSHLDLALGQLLPPQGFLEKTSCLFLSHLSNLTVRNEFTEVSLIIIVKCNVKHLRAKWQGSEMEDHVQPIGLVFITMREWFLCNLKEVRVLVNALSVVKSFYFYMKFSRFIQITKIVKVHMTRNCFISLFERAFKMMKNGVYFIVIALLVTELFKILVYAN